MRALQASVPLRRRGVRAAILTTIGAVVVAACSTTTSVVQDGAVPVESGPTDPGGEGSSDDGATDDSSGDGGVDDAAGGSGGATDDSPEGGATDDGGSGAGGGGDELAAGFVPEPVEWDSFRDNVDVAEITVPVDYADPDGATFELFVARHRAQGDRIGSLLVNPGGPGFGGSDFALFAPQIYSSELLQRFDIVGWDPRGTGLSDPPIDCIDDFDPYFGSTDLTPETEAEQSEAVAVAQSFAGECVTNNADIIDHVGTNNSARDMDVIRRALGEETISYFGFSYGSELGATWATLFPDTVRAAVLDGASDPEADGTESTIQQLRGFEGTLTTFLASCSADDSCEFHNGGDAEGAYDRLLVELDETPAATPSDRPDANQSVAVNATVQAMYSESFWPQLERALADAADGDGRGLLALHDSYYKRQPDGSYGNELEAFQVISCADEPERLSVAEEDALAPLYTEVAPRLVPEGSVGGYFCTFFPPAADPRIEITGADAGPIVVVGTTGDPSTPFESTRAMAATLEDGRFVVVEADQHTGYNVNPCINDLVDDYLVDLVAPADGTECR